MLRQSPDSGTGCPQGAVHPRTTENLPARDQAGAQARARGGVRGRAQGGVHQVEDQPKEGEEAGREEVVLRAH